MKKSVIIGAALMLTLSGNLFAQSAKQWTQKDCVDYALQNNIQLQKSIITKKSA